MKDPALPPFEPGSLFFGGVRFYLDVMQERVPQEGENSVVAWVAVAWVAKFINPWSLVILHLSVER